MARALARSLLPDEDPTPSPSWLLPGQVASFRRALAALRRHRGAVLADPVGSGKTYVALAVAAAFSLRGPIACLVPATLCAQWQSVARGLGLDVIVVSHQQVSRGHFPLDTRGVVVIDESHHFRNPNTHRYRYLAPWLAGRATLLVTATPIVNRLDDLAHQLLLGVRDDALLGDGVASLRLLLARGQGSPALGRLVIENPAIAVTRPERTVWTSRPDRHECTAATEALEAIAPLRLSARPPIASLVRAVLCRAACSSPAALVSALERYRSLLLHSQDAARAGRRLERTEIRRFTGELEQMVWWELLAAETEDMEPELDLTDLDAIETAWHRARLLAEAPDPKLDRLRALLADGLPTLVFVARRETVRYLRDRIGGSSIAWCTGERAGLGRSSVPRATVLEWFRDGAGAEAAQRAGVRHLVVTDVAAEGLDLQRAGRVIHYDLPWTPMRLEQREGRAVRQGSRHGCVEVVRFAPPPVMERALRIEGAIERKAGLPAIVGMGAAGRRLWRWRSELAAALGPGESVTGVAIAGTGPRGVLAGVSFHTSTGGDELRLASTLIWIAADGQWTQEEDVVAARLAQAASHTTPSQPDAEGLRQALELLAKPVRARLALARGRRWASAETAPSAHRVAARLQLAARDAARRRDVEGLIRLERALAFVGGGHTAGETALLERLAELNDAELFRAAANLPAPSTRCDTIEARLTGIVLFTGD